MKSLLRRFIAKGLEQAVVRLVRANPNLKIVAVGGSVGKTSTKLAISAVLSQKYRVLVQEGNYNSEIGLPLMVFGQTVPGVLFNPGAWLVRFIRAERQIRGDFPYDVLVLEVGTDHPGEIAHFMTYLKPDIGVLTAITPEHMEYFGNLDAVAAEEMALAVSSKIMVVNRDDVKMAYRTKYLKHHPQVVTYGLGKEADYSATVKDADLIGGTVCALLKNGHATIVGLTANVYGGPAMKAVTAAYAVGDLMGLSRQAVERGLKEVTPVAGRMRTLAGFNGTIIIDDTYNSSPDAVVAAVTALQAVPGNGRKIAIMGTMNELGSDSPRYHEEAGVVCAGVDMLITIGEMANLHLGPAAVKAGLDPRNWKPADSPYAAGEFLKLILQPGDIVLAKGSQNGVFAEEAVKLLLSDPADAYLLVRQSSPWLAKKAKQFGV
jgi:UDP-N-acetylmuramoyl-tripeptide--D-alanyl-D-alanine ligase